VNLETARLHVPHDGAWNPAGHPSSGGRSFGTPATPHSTHAAVAVTYEWSRELEAVPTASRLARLHTRTQLTMHHWQGNIEVAVAVASELTANAVVHANPGPCHHGPAIALRLTVTEADELLIDVSDPLPEFPAFAAAVAGHTTGHGLWQAARLGAGLAWFIHAGTDGKTVRALMTPGPVPA